MTNVDDEWNNFNANSEYTCEYDDRVEENTLRNNFTFATNEVYDIAHTANICAPEPSSLHISTTSKIAYLDKHIDLNLFWDIPVIPYISFEIGIIKKQIKITSNSQEELDMVTLKLEGQPYFEVHTIRKSSRLKFKDIKKVSIGLSKKDILDHNINGKTRAFYNCFVLIVRICTDNDEFKEYHAKVFNTGKIEIPGVRTEETFQTILQIIINTLQPFMGGVNLGIKSDVDTILINSNFNCGFFINREKMYTILKNKYKLFSIYDPCCSYPGIQCKFYYDTSKTIQTGVLDSNIDNIKDDISEKKIYKISFMIFRTGNILIGGKINETVLETGYKFISDVLQNEYHDIYQVSDEIITKDTPKPRKNKNQYIYVD